MLTPSERRRVAAHVAGHVLAMHIMGGAALLLVLAVGWDAWTRGRARGWSG